MTETRSLRSGIVPVANKALFAGLCVAFIGCGAPQPTSEPEAVAETTSALDPTVNLSGFAESLHTSGASIAPIRSFRRWARTRARARPATRRRDRMDHEQHQNTRQFLLFGGPGSAVQSGRLGQFVPTPTSPTFPARVNTFGDTLVKRGLTRFTRTISPTAEFSLIAVDDPYGFSTTTTYSGFRRPTPTANETKTSTILSASPPPARRDLAAARPSWRAASRCTSSAIRRLRSTQATRRTRPATSCSA